MFSFDPSMSPWILRDRRGWVCMSSHEQEVANANLYPLEFRQLGTPGAGDRNPDPGLHKLDPPLSWEDNR